jgi:hypothetical protein
MAICGGYPRAQNRALELHDTRLVSISEHDGTVRLRVSAYVHVSTGRPGRDVGTGWSQELELAIAGAVIESRPTDLPMWILDGSLQIDGAPEELVALPLDRAGKIRLDLVGAEGRLLVSGDRIAAEELAHAQFVERVPPLG